MPAKVPATLSTAKARAVGRKPEGAKQRHAVQRPDAGESTAEQRARRGRGVTWFHTPSTRCSSAPVRKFKGRDLVQLRHVNPLNPQAARPSIMSAAFSAIIIVAALVLPLTMLGMMEASATRRPSMP